MDFGIYLRPASTFEAMKQLAIYAEKNNYFGVFLNDHVHGFKSKGKEPYLEAWTALTAIGALTSKIRLGHVVLFNSLRNPAYLAKSITTLDILTNGRYELLIGAGWNTAEYEGYDLMEHGRGMPSAKERVDRFKESLQILRLMLNNTETNFHGNFWTLKKAFNIPLPLQQNMRISVGATRDRMIKISAKYADGINVGTGFLKVSSIIDKLKPALKKNNKSFEEFFISGFGTLTIAKNEKEYDSLARDLAKRTNRSINDIKEDVLIGTPEILIQKLNKLRHLGVKLYIMNIQPANSIEEIIEKYDFFNESVKPYLD